MTRRDGWVGRLFIRIYTVGVGGFSAVFAGSVIANGEVLRGVAVLILAWIYYAAFYLLDPFHWPGPPSKEALRRSEYFIAATRQAIKEGDYVRAEGLLDIAKAWTEKR